MNMNRKAVLYTLVSFGLIGSGCSTLIFDRSAEAPVVEEQKTIQVPAYTKIPHPEDSETSDISALFLSPLAPNDVLGKFAETCGKELDTLRRLSSAQDELKRGGAEVVALDPERTHWCFYSRLQRLHAFLKSDATWTKKERAVFWTYEYVWPVAQGFVQEFHDSRYLRWASSYYKRASEWIFFRKVEGTPENTLEQVNLHSTSLETPTRQPSSMQPSVLEKYGITRFGQ
jgi:hypothetical protein